MSIFHMRLSFQRLWPIKI